MKSSCSRLSKFCIIRFTSYIEGRVNYQKQKRPGMSFLNASQSFFNNGGDLFLGQACNLLIIEVESSFRFTDEMGPEDFMELLKRRLDDLEKEVDNYDSSRLSKKQTKAFLLNSSKRLNHISEVIQRYSFINQPPERKRITWRNSSRLSSENRQPTSSNQATTSVEESESWSNEHPWCIQPGDRRRRRAREPDKWKRF